MRKVVVHMQVTLDGRISNDAGFFWEPLPFGDRETSFVNDDIGAQLAEMKRSAGRDIVLSAGPETLGPLADRPGLIDQYLLVIHPAVLAAGPRLFDELTRDLALDLVHAEVFDAGAIIARYSVRDHP